VKKILRNLWPKLVNFFSHFPTRWIVVASLVLSIIVLIISWRQHIAHNELTLATEKTRVYEMLNSGRILSIQLIGLSKAIAKLESQLGVTSNGNIPQAEWQKILADAELPDFFPQPPGFWEVLDKVFAKLSDNLDDPNKDQSAAFYRDLSGILDMHIKGLTVLSEGMIAKRDRLKIEVKEKVKKPTN